MESPSLGLPAVNIGFRQKGRQRARNIIDVRADRDEIVTAVRQALDPNFRQSLVGMANPYGDGHAAARISEILATVPLGEQLLHKRPVQA
jgi:UDP-N-acetylglucosamine 2-epimerase (non-hydrolysing)/GDP/UDP-N,N'-diacetylbacillosamine 2-epimerase (hydrolysing)